jgi:hypothetical protein
MIQRIQTLFLGVALILMGLVAWLPLGEIAVGENIYSFTIKGVSNQVTGESVYSGLPLIIFLGIIIILQLIIINLYKKRILQIRIAIYNIIIMLGFVLISWFFVSSSLKQLGGGAYVFKIALSFPIISVILNYLAIRAIGKDEALIRSIDRIR